MRPTTISIIIHNEPQDKKLATHDHRDQLNIALSIAEYLWKKPNDKQSAKIINLANPNNSIDCKSVLNNKPIKTIELITPHPFERIIQSIKKKTQVVFQSIPDTTSSDRFISSIKKPCISLHEPSSLKLLKQGKQVLHFLINDSSLPKSLLSHHWPNLKIAVHDNNRKNDVLELGKLKGSFLDKKQVFISGTPVRELIINMASKKSPWRSGNLNILINAMGSTQEQSEAILVIKQLVRAIINLNLNIKLLIYCETNTELTQKVTKLAQNHHFKISPLTHQKAKLRIIQHQSPIIAEKILLQYGYPWADCCISHPGSSMITDATAAGCCLITMPAQNQWEADFIQDLFHRSLAHPLSIINSAHELTQLMSSDISETSWVEKSMTTAKKLPNKSPQIIANILQLLEFT